MTASLSSSKRFLLFYLLSVQSDREVTLVLTELQLISTPVASKAYSLRVLIKMLLPTR